MKDNMMVKFSEKYSLKREDYFQFLKNSIEQKDLKEIIPISIIYYLVLQIVIWLGIDTDLLKLLSAAVVAIFLAIPTWKARYFSMGSKGGKA